MINPSSQFNLSLKTPMTNWQEDYDQMVEAHHDTFLGDRYESLKVFIASVEQEVKRERTEEVLNSIPCHCTDVLCDNCSLKLTLHAKFLNPTK